MHVYAKLDFPPSLPSSLFLLPNITLSLWASLLLSLPTFLSQVARNLICWIYLGVSVQFGRSVMSNCDPMNRSTSGLPVHHQLLESIQTHVHWVSEAIQHLILCHPLLLLPSIFPSIRVFSNESALCIRWPKYWSFSFNNSPSNEYSGLISFRMDWLDLLAVQGTLKSLLQHHHSKASIFWCSAFFTVQLTSIHDHWKSHSLD